MSKTIAERLPQEAGQGVLPAYAAMKTPWGKLINYQETVHYCARQNAVISAAIMQAFRILVPDYEERALAMCQEAYGRMNAIHKMNFGSGPLNEVASDQHNVPPFCRGSFIGALAGDSGDDGLLMCGRCNDFGTYRAEKELDICDWDIVGSDLCRATTQSLQGVADAMAEVHRPGPLLEYHMVESKGCGDRKCRIVAEDRGKYPMPPHKQWECMGPVATADQIKYAEEVDTVSESMAFREECGYRWTNGTCWERDDSSFIMTAQATAALTYLLPGLEFLIKLGKLENQTVEHVIKCVCEASGKAAYGEFFAKDGARQYLGVPNSIKADDGRVLGGIIELYLASNYVPFAVEAFNEQEVIYVFDRSAFCRHYPKLLTAYLAYWYGAAKTLINAQWSLWEENSPEGKVRIKIAKKADKFC